MANGLLNLAKEVTVMTHGKVQGVFGAAMALSMLAGGCATKKHVREAIAPVQTQVNDVDKRTKDNHQAIGDLDRQVSTADEKATDAGKRADAAAQSASAANSAAQQARQQADTANSAAQQAQQNVSKLDQTVQTNFQNLDNYKLVRTEHVYFRVGNATLGKDDQEKLDAALQNIGNAKNCVVEVEGFADRTGDKTYNRELSRRRADAVVHYLAVEHNLPLRGIREVGAGSDFPGADNSNRAARKENRRVDVRVYSLDLSGTSQALNQSSDRDSATTTQPATTAPPQ
jgi:outer membrane protein OmpA-like peptidoglycan-associated protein